MTKNYSSFVLVSIILLIMYSCNNNSIDSSEGNLIEVNVADLKLIESIESEEVTIGRASIDEQINMLEIQRCKRRFPINKLSFRIKGEGYNIPIKNGRAVKVGDLELTMEVGTALTESILVIDGYNEQMCQIRKVAQQITMTCEGNDKLYKILNLQIKSNNALTSFFLAMKTVRDENDVTNVLEKLNRKIDELDRSIDEF